MKSFLFSVALFVIIIAAVIANSLYVSYVSRDLLDFSERLLYKNSPATLIEELRGFWDMHSPWLSLSVDTAEIEQIEKIIQTMKLSLESHREYDFEKQCLLLGEAARGISRLEKPTFESIF